MLKILNSNKVLWVKRIFVKDDFGIVIGWIQDGRKTGEVRPLLCDVWRSLHLFIMTYVHHIFQEVNSTIDWMASFVAKHTGD